MQVATVELSIGQRPCRIVLTSCGNRRTSSNSLILEPSGYELRSNRLQRVPHPYSL